MEKQNFTYSVNKDGTLTITGWESPQPVLNLPAEIDGHRVTAIGDRAFSDSQLIQKIILPEGLETMGRAVFNSCKHVEYIVLPNSLKNFSESLNTWLPDKPVVPVIRSYSSPAAKEVASQRRDLFFWDGPLNQEFESAIQARQKGGKMKALVGMAALIAFFAFGVLMLVGLLTKNMPLFFVADALMFASLGLTFYTFKK